MKCFACEVTSPLYRCAPKGEFALWGCIEHAPPQAADLKEIVEVIQQGDKDDPK